MPAVMHVGEFERLFAALQARGYQVIGPTVRDGAIVYDRLGSLEDLPKGWTDEQEAGRYRLRRRADDAWFGYAVGPHSWKRYLHPPEIRLFSAERDGESFRILPETGAPAKRAFLGVRACELAAISIQDRVLLGRPYADPAYRRHREGVLVIAVNCTQAAATCFCSSMGTGPQVRDGYDLVMTELTGPEGHQFLVEAGSEAGREILEEIGCRAAMAEECRRAEASVDAAASQMRALRTEGIREALYAALEHPRWDEVARRCLACANCTMVCPTCFCTTVEEISDITGDHVERWRKWDSCFSQNFSYIHGGSVRSSIRSRYRQWLTHKLASWIDQFGTSGCVGCGRCITWCPVGIDITEEVAALRAGSPAAAETMREDKNGNA
jgi:sulfhydrogenase subunit beta (sulfur reductase)